MADQKFLNFGMKQNCTIQGGMSCNGLGNRCSMNYKQFWIAASLSAFCRLSPSERRLRPRFDWPGRLEARRPMFRRHHQKGIAFIVAAAILLAVAGVLTLTQRRRHRTSRPSKPITAAPPRFRSRTRRWPISAAISSSILASLRQARRPARAAIFPNSATW